MAPKQKYLETIDIVVLDDEYFAKYQISTKETDGDTVVKDLINTHVDVCSLDVLRLKMVADHIIECIENNNHRRFTKPTLKRMLKDAVEKKRLNVADLDVDMQNKIN